MDFTEDEYQEVKTEIFELLDEAENTLLNLSEGDGFQSDYDTIFRSFHNIKGTAGMMELKELMAHAHEVETIFTQFKKAPGMSQEEVDFFLRSIDGARDIMDGKSIDFKYSIAEAKKETKDEKAEDEGMFFADDESMQFALNEFKTEAGEMVEKMFASFLNLERDPTQLDEISEIYRQAHSLKGAAGLFGLKDIGRVAHDLENSLDGLREGKGEFSAEVIDQTYEKIKKIEDLLGLKNDNTNSDTSSPAPPPPNQEKEALQVAQEPALENPVEEPPKVERQNKTTSREEVSSGSVRVSVDLLDKLMTLMGEMVLVRNQMIQYTNNSDDMDFHNLSKRLNVVTSEIQEQMMRTRMQPIGNVLNKFQRVVRDLAKKLDKDIELKIEGAETELDKSLLEAIKDPMTHIVRNSCDHGIETKDERKKTSKSKRAQVEIKAFHEGGQVVVEVKDDGRGLNKEAIINKAVERNLVIPAQIDKMTDSEIFNLIFASGFSTAKQVTNVSGRGVGMDVVRTNIESIGGTVEIKSVAGEGTSFLLKIPLTLAIVPALIVTCGENRIAIPQVKLHELVRVDQSSTQKIEIIQGTPVYRLRGNILPLVDLRSVLQIEEKSERVFGEEDVINIAVIQNEGQLIGFIVDRVMDTADIVVKPLNKLLKSLSVYSGATVLGDGSVALILDIQGIRRKIMDINIKSTKSSDGDKESRYMSYDRHDFLLVGLNSATKHALLLNFVHRLEEFKEDQIEVSGNHPVIRYRGVTLPLIFCNQVFDLPKVDKEQGKPFPVVVVEKAGRLYGLVVDRILDTLQTSEEVQPPVGKMKGVVGNLNLDKELVVVIDPFEIIEKAFPETGEKKAVKVINDPTKGKNRRVLLVEDTPYFRKVIRRTLEKCGLEVEDAGNGQEAIELLKNNESPFDLIVSDIEMPKMNGFELAENVRKLETHGSTPLLALSSRFDENYQAKGYASGFNCYMEKFKPGVLQEKIFEMIDGKVA